MKAVDQAQPDATLSATDLDRMVGPDPHRSGPARGRLLAEQVPVWALIGDLGALAGTTEPSAFSDAVVAEVACGFDISIEAVQAALRYYARHRGAIDALLEANAAALA